MLGTLDSLTHKTPLAGGVSVLIAQRWFTTSERSESSGDGRNRTAVQIRFDNGSTRLSLFCFS